MLLHLPITNLWKCLHVDPHMLAL